MRLRAQGLVDRVALQAGDQRRDVGHDGHARGHADDDQHRLHAAFAQEARRDAAFESQHRRRRQRPIALPNAAPASSFVARPARAEAAAAFVGAHALAGLRRRADRARPRPRCRPSTISTASSVRSPRRTARASTRPSRASQTLAPRRSVAPQRGARHHQRLLAAGGLDFHRQCHVLAQERRRRLRQAELDLDRAALRIDQRRDRQHARREALRRVGVRQHAGRLPGLDLPQVALVQLRHELHRAGQCQAEQRATGLHDLAGLDRAREHARIRRRGDDGLVQPGRGGRPGRAGQRQLRLGLGDVGSRLGNGSTLRARAVELRLRHRDRAAHLVETGLAEKALGDELERALQFGARGHQHRLRLHDAGLRRAAPGAPQACQARRGLAFSRRWPVPARPPARRSRAARARRLPSPTRLRSPRPAARAR